MVSIGSEQVSVRLRRSIWQEVEMQRQVETVRRKTERSGSAGRVPGRRKLSGSKGPPFNKGKGPGRSVKGVVAELGQAVPDSGA